MAATHASPNQLALPLERIASRDDVVAELLRFREFGKDTVETELESPGPGRVPVFINEFWTAKQRAAHSLHEVSYRACFKPQLPRFFIERLTRPGEVVYDPFMGRGTTLLEAALLGRVPFGADLNPLSRILVGPRLNPPELPGIEARLREIDLTRAGEAPEDLLVFYHAETLAQIAALRRYLLERQSAKTLDEVDRWIWMTATNRLTGHSPGFFSVYTLPPNQAVSVQSQRRINAKRNQTPPRRDVAKLILKKSRQLLGDLTEPQRRALAGVAGHARLFTASADATAKIRSGSVHLAVTSPPFLDTVDYQLDNWLRGWFGGVDVANIQLWQLRKLDDWQAAMTRTLEELKRILAPGGHVAFEVGEIRKGKVLLERNVVEAGLEAGLRPQLVLINSQQFTKTANCWGVKNQELGTNTNRVVLFQKAP